METSLEPQSAQIENYLWDSINLKQKLANSSMQIFHINEIKLADIQSELMSGSINFKDKEILVKIYSAFDSMHTIFKRLGVQELYDQLRLVVNSIGKIALLYEKKIKNLNNQCKICLKVKQSSRQEQQQKSCYKLTENKKKQITKFNRMGGIALFNQSYFRNIEKNSRQNDKKKLNLADLYNLNKNQQIDRQQMNFYLQQNKQLPILKIKNNSLKYQQIQDQFNLIQQRVRKIVTNLEYQFHSEKLKSFQFLSKQEISNQLLTFNQTMRGHLIQLKDQYRAAADVLMQKNKEIQNKLKMEIQRKNSLVSKQVQTVQTIASIKKVKKLSQQYKQKIQKLQIKLNLITQKQGQMQQKYDNYRHLKQKQVLCLTQKLSTKNEEANQLKKKCDEYQSTIKSKQNNLLNTIKSLEQAKRQMLIQQLFKNRSQEEKIQENLQIKSNQKIDLQKILKSRTSLHSLPRNSVQMNVYSPTLGDNAEQMFLNIKRRDQQIDKQNNSQVQLQAKYPKVISRHDKKKMTNFRFIQRQNSYDAQRVQSFHRFKNAETTQNFIQKAQLQKNVKKIMKILKNQIIQRDTLKKQEVENIYQRLVNLSVNISNDHQQFRNNRENFNQNQSSDHPQSISMENYHKNNEKLIDQNLIQNVKLLKTIKIYQFKQKQKLKCPQKNKNKQICQKKINQNLEKFQHQHAQPECLESLLTKKKSHKNASEIVKKQSHKRRSRNSRYSCNSNKNLLKNNCFKQLSQHFVPQMQNQSEQKHYISKQQNNCMKKCQIEQQYPEILKYIKQIDNKRKFCYEMQKIHKRKCKQNYCHHIQIFNKFFTKYKNQQNKKKAMRLYIQNFQSV